MKLSFIIPTLNEEKNITKVIKQFKKVNKKFEYEIIVADGGSKDKTREIARRLGVKVILNKSKKHTIAASRDLRASIAQGDVLVFCDADTQFEDLNHFISNVERVFNDERVVAAMPLIKSLPEERTWKNVVFHFIYNIAFIIGFMAHVPISSGVC